MSNTFVHLRTFSEYSFKSGMCRINQSPNADYPTLAKQAFNLNQPACAITDTGNIFAAIKFYKDAWASGVQPILGCEVDLMAVDGGGKVILLCMNQLGYHNLCSLLTNAHKQKHTIEKSLTTDALPVKITKQNAEGLILLTGANRGPLANLSHSNSTAQIISKVDRLLDCFPGRAFVELWLNGDEQTKQLSFAALNYANSRNIPVVATHPVLCTEEDEQSALLLRCAIAEGCKSDDRDLRKKIPANCYMVSTDWMYEQFSGIPTALANTVKIAKMCTYDFDFGQVRLPQIAEDNTDPNDQIRSLALAGLQQRLNEQSSQLDEYQARLDSELDVITRMDFSTYFLIVADFCKWARDNDVSVGPGRGSGAGSLVAWCLHITDIDPIEYGLLFERFLNPERISMPDFDIDFCMQNRAKVINYIKRKYGENQVSQIVTFGTLGAKVAVRDVTRVLGKPYFLGDRIASAIPNVLDIDIQKALDDSKELAGMYEQNEEVRNIIDNAKQIEGLIRQVSTHAGGVLIAPEKIDKYCPLYQVADSDLMISQFDKDDIEKQGLVKFDILGLKTLTILEIAQKHVQAIEPDFNLAHIPLDDQLTYALYQKTSTLGVFQCESSGLRELMRDMRPDNFNDIIALIALFRPGPLESGMATDYIKGKHGQAGSVNMPQQAKQLLQDTYGVVVYQEQVMQLARELANYSYGQADILRRAMGKKDDEAMADEKKNFVQRATETLGEKQASDLFDLVAKFAGYGFNKSHATAYALISYRTAYLKCNYPLAFYAAMLTIESTNQERVGDFIKDAKRLYKLHINSPDINNPKVEFTISQTDTNALDFGLSAIKGLGKAAILEIVEEHTQNGDFRDFVDFCTRCTAKGAVGKGAVEALILAGAFDKLEQNRHQLIHNLPALVNHASYQQSNENQSTLFGSEQIEFKLEQAAPYDLREQLRQELEMIGVCLSGDIFTTYAAISKKLNEMHDASTFTGAGGTELWVAGLLEDKYSSTRMKSKGSVRLKITQVSDKRSSDVFINYSNMSEAAKANLVIGQSFVVVVGKLKNGNDGQSPSISAEKLWTLDEFISTQIATVQIYCAADKHQAEPLLNQLNQLSNESAQRDTVAQSLRIIYQTDSGEHLQIQMPHYWNFAERDLQKLISDNICSDYQLSLRPFVKSE